MTPMLNMVMNLLKNKNPQMFNGINQAMQSGQNPQGLVKQVMGSMSPQQREMVIKQASEAGCPSNILSQIQNMK